MSLYLKGKKINIPRTIKTGGLYNIEVIDRYDDEGKKYQTLDITDWDYRPRPKFDPVFGNNTPAQISAVSDEISKNGYTSAQVAEIYGWNIGDTITIPLSTGENIEMQIIGINHDDLSDGSGKAGLTLEMTHCLATRYSMNITGLSTGGYVASKMKTETLPTVKSLLPQEWQNVIKLVNKKSANGSYKEYTETVTLTEDLFLLCRKEVFGDGGYAQDGENEGNWYEYYELNNNTGARKKLYDVSGDNIISNTNDSYTSWWTRSCLNNYNNYFVVISYTGNSDYYAANSTMGVSFAFCI